MSHSPPLSLQRLLPLALFAIHGAPYAAQPVIEFYNTVLDHYFVTIEPAEADAIDRGSAGPGWHRTARVFGAYSDAASAPPDATAVCRFYGNVALGGPNSHFYTANADECEAVKRDTGWHFEGIAFYVRVPVGGECGAGTAPVLRNYNRRFLQRDSNHRYTTDPNTYDAMTAVGWAAEGIVMCADATIATPSRGAPVIVSGASPLVPGCERVSLPELLYINAEVEPFLAVDPRAPDHLIGVWQQDRSNSGGARGLVTATSFDGGRTWQKSGAPFTRCTGGTVANGGDFWRASDPWVTIAPDGTAYQSALAFGGGPQQSPDSNAILVSRSRDGGLTWDGPTVVIQDGAAFFNDKESITADPNDARFAYAIWDRTEDATRHGSTWFARTTNGGDTWEGARMIYDPGDGHSTINNQLVALPDGTLVAFFTEITIANGETVSAMYGLVRSFDRGATWSERTIVTGVTAVGATDPATGRIVRDGTGLGQIAVAPSGRMVIAMQDARLSGGVRDAVVVLLSDDRGATWTAPIRVSPNLGVVAFEPAIAIARDGTIGITYFDFRNDAPDRTPLSTDLWLARSIDGMHWTETHVDGPFDLLAAPFAGGLFLGDYQGLAAVGNAFVPFYARVNSGNDGNRTDIVATFIP